MRARKRRAAVASSCERPFYLFGSSRGLVSKSLVCECFTYHFTKAIFVRSVCYAHMIHGNTALEANIHFVGVIAKIGHSLLLHAKDSVITHLQANLKINQADVWVNEGGSVGMAYAQNSVFILMKISESEQEKIYGRLIKISATTLQVFSCICWVDFIPLKPQTMHSTHFYPLFNGFFGPFPNSAKFLGLKFSP